MGRRARVTRGCRRARRRTHIRYRCLTRSCPCQTPPRLTARRRRRARHPLGTPPASAHLGLLLAAARHESAAAAQLHEPLAIVVAMPPGQSLPPPTFHRPTSNMPSPATNSSAATSVWPPPCRCRCPPSAPYCGGGASAGGVLSPTLSAPFACGGRCWLPGSACGGFACSAATDEQQQRERRGADQFPQATQQDDHGFGGASLATRNNIKKQLSVLFDDGSAKHGAFRGFDGERSGIRRRTRHRARHLRTGRRTRAAAVAGGCRLMRATRTRPRRSLTSSLRSAARRGDGEPRPSWMPAPWWGGGVCKSGGRSSECSRPTSRTHVRGSRAAPQPQRRWSEQALRANMDTRGGAARRWFTCDPRISAELVRRRERGAIGVHSHVVVPCMVGADAAAETPMATRKQRVAGPWSTLPIVSQIDTAGSTLSSVSMTRKILAICDRNVVFYVSTM